MKKYNFNKNSDSYDKYYLTEFGIKVDKIEKQCVSEFISKIPKGKTLEIGCGTGHWTEFFVENGFSITAIDVANEMLKIAQKKNLYDVKFLNENILSSNFKDEFFDNIFAVTSLEFVENQEKAFSEIFRILKKGGYFMVAGLLKNSEIGINKDQNETFRNADFFTHESMTNYLSKFGKSEIKQCLKIKNGEIIDNEFATDKDDNSEDAFIVGIVKKR